MRSNGKYLSLISIVVLIFLNLYGIVSGISLTQFEEALNGEDSEVIQIFVQKPRSQHSPYTYHVQLKAFDRQFNLNLKRTGQSVFSKNFRFGRRTIIDKAVLDRIENEIFVDSDSMAVLSLTPTTTGSFEIRGVIQDIGIVHEAVSGRHYARRRPPSTKDGSRDPECDVRPEDHVDFEPLLIPLSNQNTNTYPVNGQTRTADMEPEIVMVLDLPHQEQMEESTEKMISYCCIMINAVQVIYNSMDGPKLIARLCGVYALGTADHKKIVEQQGANPTNVLAAFRLWGEQVLQQYFMFDMATFCMGVRARETSGAFSTTAGIAYMGTVGTTYPYSLSDDTGCAWLSYFTVAHEMLHTMNCGHDFNTVCGQTQPGRIMDYNRNSSAAYLLSDCSKDDLRKGANNKNLYVVNCYDGYFETGVDYPGDWLTFEEQCKSKIEKGQYGVYLKYVPETDPAYTCVRCRCNFKDENGDTWQIVFPLPHENTKCGDNGEVCKQGNCVKP